MWPDKSIEECSDEELLMIIDKVSSEIARRNTILKNLKNNNITHTIKTAADAFLFKNKKT